MCRAHLPEGMRYTLAACVRSDVIYSIQCKFHMPLCFTRDIPTQPAVSEAAETSPMLTGVVRRGGSRMGWGGGGGG